LKPFRLHEPTTIEETVGLLSKLGESAKLYAGGTELLLAMRSGFLHYTDLVNVKTVAGLDAIAVSENTLSIGPNATHSSIERSDVVRNHSPLIAEVEHRVANVRVRNVGTLGGNLCFAEPHSDPGALLLLFDAEAEVAGPRGRRQVAISDMLVGAYETTIAPDEMLVSVSVLGLPAGMGATYAKFGYHHRPTLGMGAAVLVADGVVSDVRLTLGSVPPNPLRLSESEAVLKGERANALADENNSAIAEAGRLATDVCNAVDDLHGSAEYKRHLVEVFVGRTVRAALAAQRIEA
jgi:carbon-monoxide dehydrogenase medium subunit